jgi:regulation of enolase protein 1 (concanavalin A-like superfamily)
MCCIVLAISCKERDKFIEEINDIVPRNIDERFLNSMSWINLPEEIDLKGNVLKVTTTKGTDYFNNPEDGSITKTAPFLAMEKEGDFVMKALVEPDFTSQWNAVALMVYGDSTNWIKFAFENSDATGSTIVSVVTKGASDDANGAVMENEKKVWLAIARKGDIYSMHWSKDGESYKMSRLTRMPVEGPAKIGIEFQSPVGEKAVHLLHWFSVENRTLDNMRSLKNG